MSKLGVWLFLGAVIAWTVLEIWVVVVLADVFREPLGVILTAFILSFIGYKLVRRQASGLPLAMMDGSIGRRVVGLLGAILLTLPGYVSGLIGIILLLPPVQVVFANVAGTIFQTMAKRTMEHMAKGGGFPGGGFARGGFPGAGFPGGGFAAKTKPDDRVGGPKAGKKAQHKPGKVIDAEFEKN